MNFKKIEPTDIAHFQKIIGDENLLLQAEKLIEFGSDETENLNFPPEVVLIPKTTFEIAEIVKYCNKKTIPITPRGAGTGLSGGALPVFGGV